MASEFFNFKDLTKKGDLWKGGMHRGFNTPKATVMNFKIPKGFKFDDKGHKNEQITILLKGRFKFYINNKIKIMPLLELPLQVYFFLSFFGLSYYKLNN